MKKKITALSVGLLLSAGMPFLAADSGSRAPAGGGSSIPQRTPAQVAAQLYNQGLKSRDKAWKLEEKAAAAASQQQAAKLQGKAQKEYQRAIKKFRGAIERNSLFHEAYSSLGYALRRTGEFEESLKAYDMALVLAPDYSEAIEYRAEAYLGLDRIEDAKTAYLILVRQEKPQADKLLQAMREWVKERREDSRVETSTIDSFDQWIEQRSEISAQTRSGADSPGDW